MIYVAGASVLLALFLLIGFNIRTKSWRNRRMAARRKIRERRKSYGRRKQYEFNHKSKLADRRMHGERRKGPVTRRHKHRRAEDRSGRH